jgi:uncharacterized protein YbgA (DUF1722 family)/uncharacterized protein YbbK (DUF523 family)
MAIRNPASKIKVGVSSCLLGEKVRWDGNHKQDSVIKNQLRRIFEWVPTCPEVEIGMGIPRESVQLTGGSKAPLMVGNRTGTDWTRRMNRYSQKRSAELERMDVCGYIFKSKSPSCGIGRIPVIGKNGKPQRNGRGLFAEAFMRQCSLIPVEDEDRLHDARIRENFITRVFAYHRLRQLLNDRLSRKALVEFHTAHKFLLLAHSRKHYDALGKLVANAKQLSPSKLKLLYAEQFMRAFTSKTTIRKNFDVLYHMLGFFKKLLSESEKRDVIEAIEDYRKERVPLTKPITLIQRHARKYKVDDLADQVYLRSVDKKVSSRYVDRYNTRLR